jgi:hypothetical protein
LHGYCMPALPTKTPGTRPDVLPSQQRCRRGVTNLQHTALADGVGGLTAVTATLTQWPAS